MNIIIVGCGKVGSTLAKSLVAEKHNITLIDKDQETLNHAMSNIDCMSVIGNGAIQSVLIEAEIQKADLLIACTSSDEINILTCLIARKSSKCKTIARIRNPEYAHQIEYIMKELDISFIINPELATAREIVRITRYSNSISSDSFFKGRLILLKVNIPEESNIFGSKLIEISKKIKSNILMCVIERGDEIIIPTGNSVLKKGDKILFAADHQNAISFFDYIGFEYKQLNSYLIVGGGRITHYLIDILTANNKKCNIKVIEKDKKLCEDLIEKFPFISVVCADATDKNVLTQEGIQETDAFITLTGIDEENIILSLYASNNKNIKVITKINHLNFVDSLKDIQLGSVVNPEKIASSAILRYVRGVSNVKDSNLETLYRLCNDRVEALSFKVKDDSRVTNIKLKDLKLKPNVIVAGIYRKDSIIRPNGFDEIKVGDRVVIITKDNNFKDISEIIV